MTPSPQSIAIIGAGVAGLVTAKTLVARGYDCTVFEAGTRVGGVWAAGYPGFGVQVQRELYEFPDWPLPADVPDFTPGELVQRHLEDYARHFAVWPRIVFATPVRELRADPAGGWLLTTEHDGERASRHFDFVVACTGLYSNRPHRPSFAGEAEFRGEILHLAELGDRERLRGRRVAIVGFGKSASDAALEAAAVARATTIVFRAPHWPVPARLLGILPFKWAMLNRLTSSLLPPHYRPSALERALHSIGKPLVWLWWRIVEGLLVAQFGLGSRDGTRPDLVPKQPIEREAFSEAVMLPRPAFYRALRSGLVEPLQTEIATLTPTGAVFANGATREFDTLLLATGWETDYGWIARDLRETLHFDDDGLYLYRQMLSPDVPGLAFVGYASTITSTLTYNLQARWLADLLDDRHRLPAAAAMREDVDAQRAWKRRTMPFSRGRAARLLLHMLHYHDSLLEDIGVTPLRKRGWYAPFKEVFAPYEPRDYREVAADRE
ncbi:MAG: FAD-dependent oxidoreductase [Gammaproteobacteria bacterium]|nr:FAD-dependent oxidoreductase [Gammaproteobacteria bacterium]